MGDTWAAMPEFGMISPGAGEIVLVGFSRAVLAALTGQLPPGSVVVVEDPLVAEHRAVTAATDADPLVHRLVLAEYHQSHAIDRLLAELPELRSARAVVPGVEYAVEAAARLAAGLGLPGAGLTAAAVFRDKARQRQVAETAGIPNPRWTIARTEAEAIAFTQAVGAGCVVKPTARQASAGVRFVHPDQGPALIAAAYQQADSAGEARLMPAGGIPSAVIVEEAVHGKEYSVEMLVRRGQPCFANVTGKTVAEGAYPVELGHLVPDSADAGLVAGLVQATTAMLKAAEFETGVLHCEWIVNQAGHTLVECAGRIPGDEITTLISLAYDRPFIPAYLQVLLGDDPQYPQHAAYGSAIRFLTVDSGRVTRVQGVTEATQLAGVQQAQLTVAPGDLVLPLTSSWDRAGYVITRAATAAQAGRVAEDWVAQIEVTVEPESRAACP